MIPNGNVPTPEHITSIDSMSPDPVEGTIKNGLDRPQKSPLSIKTKY